MKVLNEGGEVRNAMSKSVTKINFFNSYFEELERRGIASVVLHTYEHYPEVIHSDIDYCVSDIDLNRILPLVYEHCVSSGWRLVQIMQHEVKAFFCICVSIDEPNTYLELDVCSDYMREGKVLIDADHLLEGRRKLLNKVFFAPSVGVEYGYTLWKGVAKRKELRGISGRLMSLASEDNEACIATILNLGLAENFKEHTLTDSANENFYNEMSKKYGSLPKYGLLQRVGKLWRRVYQPTGLLVNLASVVSIDEGQIRERVLPSVSHAFRQQRICAEAVSMVGTLMMGLKSTLVILHKDGVMTKSLVSLASVFKFGLTIESSEPEAIVKEIHIYLEDRLLHRWQIKRIK